MRQRRRFRWLGYYRVRRYGVLKVKPIVSTLFFGNALGCVVQYYYHVGHFKFFKHAMPVEAKDEFDAYQKVMHKLRTKQVVSEKKFNREKRRLIRQQTKATKGRT